MKNLFKSFLNGGYYYGVALYILILFLLDVKIEWWIISTVLFAILFCFVDYFSTIGIRDALSGESYWRNQYFLEKQSHKGSIKKYLNKLKEADQTIVKLSEEKANLLDSISYYKEAK